MSAISVERTWVAGVASAPLYVVIAVLISGLSLMTWFITFIGAVLAIAVLYRKFVVQMVARGYRPGIVLAWWGAAQVLFIAASVWIIQTV